MVAGTAGCVIGSAIAYGIGLKGGRGATRRYGKCVFLNEGHLFSAERWFNRHGAAVIFVTRLLPIIRTYVSFPVGMARMRFTPFIILTAIGSAIWCFVLAHIGYILGPSRNLTSGYYDLLTIAVVAIFSIILVAWYLRRRSSCKERAKK